MGSISLNGSADAHLAVGQDLLGAMLDGGQPAMYLCMAGSCGRCRGRITAGAELLEPMTDAEDHHGCDGEQRLACQARLARDGRISIHQPA
ncbi:MAG: (2Fe-2S)-binding protein [Planctomycetes bacterium]|nr:(2Fe-2S)-binding protein [Planctomycetota bacterium]